MDTQIIQKESLNACPIPNETQNPQIPKPIREKYSPFKLSHSYKIPTIRFFNRIQRLVSTYLLRYHYFQVVVEQEILIVRRMRCYILRNLLVL
jgi:hypothetical protein